MWKGKYDYTTAYGDYFLKPSYQPLMFELQL